MDRAEKTLTIEEKLELVRGRAVRFGIRRHDLEDAVQDVILDLLEFTPDPEKSNGASESTILIAVIDRRLMEWLRTRNRYRGMVERCGAMLPSDEELSTDSNIVASDTAMDVASVLANLPEFEQRVARMLSQGYAPYSIADELRVGRRAVSAAMEIIRERLSDAGLGGEELA